MAEKLRRERREVSRGEKKGRFNQEKTAMLIEKTWMTQVDRWVMMMGENEQPGW